MCIRDSVCGIYAVDLPDESQSTTISAAAIENVKFDYQPGDAPRATAKRAANQYNYDILYECWQQFENNQPVAAWYSDNDSHGSLPTITAFENGKTYVVENEAGKGFVNAAQTGSLKIVKTSSDGKVEGFSFRVPGVNGYDKTFTTDRNGEIFVEGLRIGDYTVSEVNDKASAGYILPADKQATVKVDATAIVQMHNEFRDTPKTGDDFNLGLWVSLAALSVVGAGVLGFVGYKNRKKKKED